MPVAALLLAMAAGPHSPFDGRLPARGQVQAAFAASRACRDGPTCPPTTIEIRNERCYRIERRRGGRAVEAAVAGARCRFQFSERIDAGHTVIVTRWAGTHADFFLVGAPCGDEGQEADLTCYSWMTPRGEN